MSNVHVRYQISNMVSIFPATNNDDSFDDDHGDDKDDEYEDDKLHVHTSLPTFPCRSLRFNNIIS